MSLGRDRTIDRHMMTNKKLADRSAYLRACAGRRFAKSSHSGWVVLCCLAIGAGVVGSFPPTTVWAQTAFTWGQIKEKFEASNPTLQAAQMNVIESRAAEVTAFLRPNPDFSTSIDQIAPFSTQPSPVSNNQVYRPLANDFPAISFSYLH